MDDNGGPGFTVSQQYQCTVNNFGTIRHVSEFSTNREMYKFYIAIMLIGTGLQLNRNGF